jgi:hypothetical protein
VDATEEMVELNEESVIENSDSAKENESEDTECIPFNPAGMFSFEQSHLTLTVSIIPLL